MGEYHDSNIEQAQLRLKSQIEYTGHSCIRNTVLSTHSPLALQHLSGVWHTVTGCAYLVKYDTSVLKA